MKKTNFDDKLKNINKKVTSNKTKQEDGEKKKTHKMFYQKKVSYYWQKDYNILFCRMYFIGDDDYQSFYFNA